MKSLLYLLLFLVSVSAFIKYQPENKTAQRFNMVFATPVDELTLFGLSFVGWIKKWKKPLLILIIGVITLVYLYFTGFEYAMLFLVINIVSGGIQYAVEALYE